MRTRLGSAARRPAGLRAGITIGLALALIGIAVGTATGAVTPFQQVVVVNAPSSPIPVTGSVNVANTPANQNVTVTNFPATQPVSGTVNVGNLPAAQKATKVYNEEIDVGPESLGVFEFGQTINVTSLIVYNDADDGIIIRFGTLGGGVHLWEGDGGHIEQFPVAVPMNYVEIWCRNFVLDCTTEVTAIGW